MKKNRLESEKKLGGYGDHIAQYVFITEISQMLDNERPLIIEAQDVE